MSTLTQCIASGGLLANDGTPTLVQGGDSVTTTWGTIRDQLVTTVEALTPTSIAERSFVWAPRFGVEYEQATDFEAWAELNDPAVFRMFDIVLQAGWEAVGVNNGGTQRRFATLALSLAYPDHFAMYGDDNSGDRDDLLEQDIAQIAQNIGLHGAASWVTAATPVNEAIEFEDGEGVRYARLVVDFEYTY